MNGLLLVFAAIGLLLIGLAQPLINRRVKPNVLYGLRVPATCKSVGGRTKANNYMNKFVAAVLLVIGGFVEPVSA